MVVVSFFITELLLGLILHMSMRKGALQPFPDVAIIYMMVLIAVLHLQIVGVVDYRFINTYSSFSFMKTYPLISLASVIYAGGLYFTKPRNARRIDYREIIQGIQVSSSAIIVSAVATYVLIGLHLWYANFNIIWENSEYLLSSDKRSLDVLNPFSNFILQLQSPLGLFFSALMFFLYAKNDKYYLVFVPAYLWRLAFVVGSHSRIGAMMLAIGAMICLMSGKKKTGWVLLFLFAVALLQALDGRGEGLHGVSQAPMAFTYAYRELSDDAYIGNSAEGIFVSSEVLDYRPNYSMRYATLSFSPLISAVDGFAKILESDEQRLSTYVPRSAIDEVFSFGFWAPILFFATQFYAARKTLNAITRNPTLLPVALNLLVLLGFLMQFSYPVRNTYRFFVYPLIGLSVM